MTRTIYRLVFLLLICSQSTAAQETLENITSTYTVTGCRYWFDNSVTVIQADYTSGKFALDVSQLEEGFHTLHYQILDSNGGVSPSCTSPFFRLQTTDEVFKDYTIKSVRYWFDKDYTPKEVAYFSGTSSIDVSALEEGFHTLHYQVIDSHGESSPSRTVSFFRLQTTDETFKDYTIKSVRYWFDKDYTPREVTYTSGTSCIDVSALEEGFHTLHYQVIDSNGESSPSRTSSFFRVQATDETFKDYTIKSVRYWFDKDYTPREVAYTNGTSSIDVSGLEEGFHTLHYQVIASNGECSPSRTSSFFRLQTTDETFKDYTIKSVRYWFDKDYTPQEVAYTNGTSSIDVSGLEEGFHTLHYQVIASNGECSPPRTSPFFRLQPVEEKFKDYAVQTVCYWSDNDLATARTESFAYGTKTLDLSYLSEGPHTLCYQVMSDDGQVSPVRSTSIERWLYDIYVSKQTTYTESDIESNPLFANRPELKLHYMAADLNVRGHLKVDAGTTFSLGKFVQTGHWGYYNNSNKYTKVGVDYYHPTTLLNYGFMRADSVIVKESLYRDKWHFISLPFNVNVSNIDVPDDTYWVIRRYDGDARAAGLMDDTWRNLRSDDQMEAGKGYIVQLTKEGDEKNSILVFKAINDTKKNDIFMTSDATVTLREYRSEFAQNRSWNFIGNPYPCFFDSRYIGHDGNIIVWNGNGYSAFSLQDDDYVLMPFEAFFIQKPLNTEVLTMGKEGRQQTPEVQAAPARVIGTRGNVERSILNLTLTDGSYSDHSRIVVNERASTGYENDKDAPKFMEKVPLTPQLFSVESGVKYAINERPYGDGYATFSIYVPVAGEYCLKADGHLGINDNLMILDTETNEVWPLSNGDFVFTAEAGWHDGRFILSLSGNITAISQVNVTEDGEMQVIGGQLSFRFAKAKNVHVYGMDGRIHFSGTMPEGSVCLSSGIYVVDIDGKTSKVIVK